MRLTTLQDLIAAGVSALPVDDAATSADVHTRNEGESDQGQPRPEWSFDLLQGQIRPTTTFEARTLTSVFELRFYFADGPRTAVRIASVGERVLCFLPTINGAMHPEIDGCGEIGDWVPSEDDVTGQIVCAVSFAVTYHLTF